MYSFRVLHHTREILQNEASQGNDPLRGQRVEYLLDKEKLSELEEREGKGDHITNFD